MTTRRKAKSPPKELTSKQKQVLGAVKETGSVNAAAKYLGISRSTARTHVERISAKYPELIGGDKHIPAGHRLSGVSTLVKDVGDDGEVIVQWQKTTADAVKEQERIDAIIEGLNSTVKARKPVKQTIPSKEDILSIYVVSDHHIGQLSWEPETGSNYDTDIARDRLLGSMHSLISRSDRGSEALIVFLGDLLHQDSLMPLTPKNKNVLDTDSRFALMAKTAVEVIEESIQMTLQRHSKVSVILESGNHDGASSVILRAALALHYRKEPRVSVDESPGVFHYFKWGNNLLGTHHGDTVRKPAALVEIMAADKGKEWGQTEHRFWFTGHIHHDRLHDGRACRVESFRTLASPDMHSIGHGYRSTQDMKCIILHREFGEVGRNIVKPSMLGETNAR